MAKDKMKVRLVWSAPVSCEGGFDLEYEFQELCEEADCECSDAFKIHLGHSEASFKVKGKLKDLAKAWKEMRDIGASSYFCCHGLIVYKLNGEKVNIDVEYDTIED